MSEEHDPWEEVRYHLEADLAAREIAKREAAGKKSVEVEDSLDTISVRRRLSPKKLFAVILSANIMALAINPSLLYLSLPLSMLLTMILALAFRPKRVKKEPRRLRRRWAA